MKFNKIFVFITVIVASILCVFACSSMQTAGAPDIGGKVAETRAIPRFPVRQFSVEVDLYDQDQIGFVMAPLGYFPAAKFNVDFNIKGFTFCMATINDNTKNSVVFRLYNWKETYKDTVNSEPIVVITKRDIQQNENVTFEVDDGVAPPGTYLWTLTEAVQRDPDSVLSIYSQNPKPEYNTNAVFFINGYESNDCYHKVIIGGVRAEPVIVESAEGE